VRYDLDHREVENFWPAIVARKKYGPLHGFRLGVAAWMNDNMLHSMATCMGTDVALIKIMEQGQVIVTLSVYSTLTCHHRQRRFPFIVIKL
jgi:hypothetical protein